MRVVERNTSADLVVKTLSSQIASKPDWLNDAKTRFEQELRSAKEWNEVEPDRTVRLIDSDCTGDMPYGVFEFLSAPTLDQFVARTFPTGSQVPVHIATEVADGILLALESAHARQLVHRDLKPSNVFVLDDKRPGEVKLADFGIAVDLDLPDRITLTGEALGTPGFMPPEQMGRAKYVTSRSDVFAVGAILYWLLTRQTIGKAHDAMWKTPSPRVVRPEVPLSISQAVIRALQRRSEDRYGNAAEFRAALAGPTAGSPSNAGSSAGQRRTTVPVWVLDRLRLWQPLDTSSSELPGLIPSSPQAKVVLQRIVQALLPHNQELDIQRINQLSGTVNFRLTAPNQRPLLIRVHSNKSPEELRSLHHVQNFIRTTVFDNDAEHADMLRALRWPDGDEFKQYDVEELSDCPLRDGCDSSIPHSHLISAYPFAVGVNHYDHSIEGLASFAQKLALLHNALNGDPAVHDAKLDQCLKVLEARAMETWKPIADHEFQELLVFCRDIVSGRNRARSDIALVATVVNAYEDPLRELWAMLLNRPPSPSGSWVLNDCHTHNVFWVGSRCVVIYDHEILSRMRPETQAVAFALHRSAREFSGLKPRIDEAAPRFLDEYYGARGASRPPDLAREIVLEGYRVYMDKLTWNLQYLHLGVDRFSRPREAIERQVLKFIACLGEIRAFESVLLGSQGLLTRIPWERSGASLGV